MIPTQRQNPETGYFGFFPKLKLVELNHAILFELGHIAFNNRGIFPQIRNDIKSFVRQIKMQRFCVPMSGHTPHL